MNLDDQFTVLRMKLRADPRIEGFQGLHLNACDGSLLVIYRWGGAYFESFGALDGFLTNPEAPLKVAGL